MSLLNYSVYCKTASRTLVTVWCPGSWSSQPHFSWFLPQHYSTLPFTGIEVLTVTEVHVMCNGPPATSLPGEDPNEKLINIVASVSPLKSLFNVLCGRGCCGFQLSPCPGLSCLLSKSFCPLSICTSSIYLFSFMCPGKLVVPELIVWVVCCGEMVW